VENEVNRLQKALKNSSGAPLLGAAAYLYNPTFLEIAALLGYKAAWIEMEHTFLSHDQAADLCRIASGMGMLTMIRIPDTRREMVLKAAECGPDILDLPMANSAAMLNEFVRHARFPPKGERGFFSTSRAVKYGLDGPVSDEQQMVNQELCLMAQIETKEAVDKIEELLAVPGIDSIFIGPADLSASLGVPGQTDHLLVKQAAAKVIQAARTHGKTVAAGVNQRDLPFWIEQGIDLIFCTNDIAAMKAGAQAAISDARNLLEKFDGAIRK
jgi:4-hydroxy-2-oxoheptanedioate aldolase